mgnify:CR=1 FL=1
MIAGAHGFGRFRCNAVELRRVYAGGGLLLYPTESVWGLGCDPMQRAGVERLLALKGRKPGKGLIIITGDVKFAQPFLAAAQVDKRFVWPMHTTLLLPDPEYTFSQLVRGEHTYVAIRVSRHPFVRWFSRNIAPFLVSTSANFSGSPAARRLERVHPRLGAQVDLIVPGLTLGKPRPSTIRALNSEQLIRR